MHYTPTDNAAEQHKDSNIAQLSSGNKIFEHQSYVAPVNAGANEKFADRSQLIPPLYNSVSKSEGYKKSLYKASALPSDVVSNNDRIIINGSQVSTDSLQFGDACPNCK